MIGVEARIGADTTVSLETMQLVYDRAVELDYEFHQGVALVMKSLVFGLITDLWGDAPYSTALKGELGGGENIKPAYDSQEDIYTGIMADLETANTLLSKDKDAYSSIVDNVDVYYNGDPAKWRKLANSLMLRYYMRISAKKADVAKAGIEKIVANPSQYPIITSESDDAAMAFPGTSRILHGLQIQFTMPVVATIAESRWRLHWWNHFRQKVILALEYGPIRFRFRWW